MIDLRARMSILLGFAITGMLASAACGLFPSFDGFAGDERGLDAASEGSFDGPTDSPNEGGTDARVSDDAEAGAVPCAEAVSLPGIILCEDFETGRLDTARWATQRDAGGTSVVEATHAHRGSYVLHSHANAVGADGGIVDTSIQDHTTPLPASFFVRVFVFVPSPAPPGDEGFVALVEGQPPYDSVALDVRGGALTIEDSVNHANYTAPSAFPRDRWVCVEWKVTSGTPGEVRGWMDDVEIPSLHATPSVVPTPGLIALGIGLFPAPMEPAVDVWIDDLLVATDQVGCAR